MDDITKAELKHIIRISLAVGGLDNAVWWIQRNAEISLGHEPDWNSNKVAWIKWFRSMTGCELIVAKNVGERKYGAKGD